MNKLERELEDYKLAAAAEAELADDYHARLVKANARIEIMKKALEILQSLAERPFRGRGISNEMVLHLTSVALEE